MTTPTNQAGPTPGVATRAGPHRPGRILLFVMIILVAAVATAIVFYVLIVMFSRKQEARHPFVRVAEVNELSTDPAPWGLNWPHQFDGYLQTAGDAFDGGSSALPESKLDQSPWLRRLYAGYAFSIDYREARGHAYMLFDQGVTERVTQKPQAGACLHCHGSTTVLYRQVGLQAMGQDDGEEALAAGFNMPAVRRGFEELSRRPYAEVQALLQQTPDGTPGENEPVFPQAPTGGFTGQIAGQPVADPHAPVGEAHPVSCIDCHNPATLAIRVTRPGFMQGIADLAASDEPMPHMPSIERWRRGNRATPYDPNALASRQEMRSFVCGQCHVEYYCANRATLTFPWGNGLGVEDIEAYWEGFRFEDGAPFHDYVHGETGAPSFKAQHPEFELWNQGVHARNGVSCADCHMPYMRQGAMKVSSHNVQSPLATPNNSCQQCHNVDEAQLVEMVRTIQGRTRDLMERAAHAMTDMLDAIREAKAAGATDEQLAEAYTLQRRAMWRLDFISSENSDGFHADQEAARILGESIDFSRQAQAIAIRLRAPAPPSTESLPVEPVQGVTPASPPSGRAGGAQPPPP